MTDDKETDDHYSSRRSLHNFFSWLAKGFGLVFIGFALFFLMMWWQLASRTPEEFVNLPDYKKFVILIVVVGPLLLCFKGISVIRGDTTTTDNKN